MNNKCIVFIKGMQAYNDETEDTDVSLTSEAEFKKDEDGVYFIKYEESEITGLEGTKTCIEIGSNYVSLHRNGAVNTNMLFMKDRKTSSFYATPYGDMLIGIFTDNLKIDIDETGGTVSADYFIDINNESTGKNNFEIEIKGI